MTPIDPVALARHYTAFLRPGRILLTGHSHQAWPDVAAAAMAQAFHDAADHVDDKWSQVMDQADRV
ncbi:MAG: kynureninase, partial [bacterium]